MSAPAFLISPPDYWAVPAATVTRAGLTLTADGWTNSSVIQADRLTVNINSLNQTASGQLAVSTLTGNGGNWNNDGLIASDDSLSLTLGGTYSGNGRVSSLERLALALHN
jgi:filamentous hemagglutinin